MSLQVAFALTDAGIGNRRPPDPLAKLEATGATGAPVDREELRHHLHARYVL